MSAERLQILIVDDDAGLREEMSDRLAADGHVVQTAPTGELALSALSDRAYDVAFVDLNLGGGMSGIDVLKQARAEHGDLTVVLISERGSIAAAVEATKLGAFDFLEKPFDRDRLRLLLSHLLERAALKRRAHANALPGSIGVAMVGGSEALRKLMSDVERVAPTQGKVLITGENGSGKDLVARAIHLGSRRADRPFVKLNCAAIPKDLLESELFGYEKGAFTGAMQAKKGKLELADGGTLFLDEIGDLSLDAQAKLLRAIETGEVERVGGTRTTVVDVRIVSATHKDLPSAVRGGTFREDLYFRLNVLPIHVPPLRERREDIPLLAEHFAREFAEAEGLGTKELTLPALAVLTAYSWPGNVRELRNLMERAVILVPGPVIDAADLREWLVPVTRAAGSPGAGGHAEAPGEEEPANLREELERRESDAILKVLESVRWNVTQAAAQLGVDRTNLHRKMRKYGIHRNSKEDDA
ncbi:MAG: sigma-54 dependent transcriptional regulator [Candidatus Eisenbacteria bacterium]